MASIGNELTNTQVQEIQAALRGIRENRNRLRQQIAVIVQQRFDNQGNPLDGSSAAHYHTFALEAGIEAGTYADADVAAKAGFDEISSVDFILNKQGGEGDAAGVAIDQACAKWGV